MRRATFLASAVLLALLAAQVSAQGPRSVWDGVYAADQAKRGEALASTQCALCHGDGLRGGESAPPLTGDLFNANWEGVTLVDLADRIRTTMPLDKPGSLSRQQTTDLVAYVLSLSKIPAGTSPLPADAGALGALKYESYAPQR